MVSVHKKFQKDISKTFGEIDDNVFAFCHNMFFTMISDDTRTALIRIGGAWRNND